MIELYKIETVWKTLVKKCQHSKKAVKNLFPCGKLQFEAKYRATSFPPGEAELSWKIEKKYGCMKACFYIERFLLYMTENRQYFPFLLSDYPYQSISRDALLKIIHEIELDDYFSEIVKICMKKSYEIGLSSHSKDRDIFFNKQFGKNNLRAKRSDVMYPLV